MTLPNRLSSLVILAGILGAVPALAQVADGFPANPGFERALDGWTVLGGQGVATAGPARGAVGDSALTLGEGWVISEPGEAPLSGWLAVSLRARPAGGREHAGRLLLALADFADAPPRPSVALPADAFSGDWRPVRVELLAPGGAPVLLAIGADGPGPWQVDAVKIEPFTPEPSQPETPAVIPPQLPPGWQPDGTLDARERTILNTRELLLSVGGLEISIPDAAAAPRGNRGALPVTVNNRGMAEKQLTISVAGPACCLVPERTVTIRPSGTTIFHASLQSLALGEAWTRVTFRCEGEEAAAPVKLTTTPSYPAAGLVWLSRPPTDAELAQATALDAGLLAVALPSDEAAQHLPSLPASFTRVMLIGAPWSEARLSELAARLPGAAEAVALDYPRGEQPPPDARAMTAALAHPGGALVLGPPLDPQPSSPPALPAEAIEDTCTLGAAGQIAAATLRPPVLDPVAVGSIMVGNRSLRAAQPAWTALSSAVDFDAIAAALRERTPLPLFFTDLAARSSGSPEADAVTLARTVAACMYQGATGFTVRARPEDCPPGAEAFAVLDAEGSPRGPVAQAFSELSRELSGAMPLRVFSQTPEIGLADDALVGFRPFMRGDEGILAMWNNTGANVDLIFETRTQPLDLHTVSISAGGVTRSYVGAFHYSDDAIALNRPVVFVSLRPGEFKLLSMQLARAHAGWLGAVEFQPPIPRERRGPPNDQRFGVGSGVP